MKHFLRHFRILDGLFALKEGIAYLLGRRPRSKYKKPDPYIPFIQQLERRELPAGGILEYAIPTSASGPRGIAAQSPTSDIVWFVEGSTNKVAKIDANNSFTEYTITTSSSSPWDIAAAPSDSAMWFTEAAADQIGRVDYDGNISEYALTSGSTPHGITLGPDGNLWFTMPGRGYVGYITTGGSITEYNVGGQPENIVTVGSDLFFTDYSGNKIVKITTGGTTTPYTVPTANSQPYGIAAGPDGNVWFTEYATHKIGKMTTGGTFTEYALTSGSNPRDIAAGLDATESYLIFTEPGTNKIGRITTGGTVTEWTGLTSSSAPEGIAERSGGAFLFTENGVNKIGKGLWTAAGSELRNDPYQAVFVSYGSYYESSPQTGEARVWMPLDLQARTTPDVFGASPSLVYVSGTTNVKPILQTTFYTVDGSAAPTGIDLQLTWNGGSPQSWVSFTTTGHSAGDTYLLADQVATAVTGSGLYTWQLEVKATYYNGNVFRRITTGSTYVIVNGSSSPFGHGWNLSGVDRVTAVTGGMMWESATGGYRFFAGSGGTYTSPSNDFGTLVKNVDNSYTYTAKDQFKWDFDSSGKQTKQTDPHGLLRTFLYDAGGRVTSITEPDGTVATFQYNVSNKLEKITAPGNRVYTITVDGSGDLTGVVQPDGSLRTFTYSGSHQLTNDKIGLVNTTLAYDTRGTVTTITLDAAQSAHQKVSAASVIPLSSAAKNQSDGGKGVVTDALNRSTTYLLDSLGRATQMVAADGGTWSYQLNSAGLATVTIDGRSNRVTTTFNGSGDATQIDYSDGTSDKYTYHATFHKVTSYEDRRSTGGSPILTTYTYNSTNGDLESIEDATNQRTTYTWSNGLLTGVLDALGNRTTYTYTSRRLSTETTPHGATNYLYDAAGNATVTIDGLTRRTTTQFDGMRHPTTITYANTTVVTYLYNANGLVTDQTDDNATRSTFAYDQRLQLTASTYAAGQLYAKTSFNYYDAVGNLTGSKDPNNLLTAYLYDALNRQTGVTDPVSGTSSTYFDLAGNVSGVRDAVNNLTQFLFDSLNRSTVTIDGSGNRATSLLDLAGNVTGMRNGPNQLSEVFFNALGQMTGTRDTATGLSENLFDAAGNLTVSVDPRGNRTTYLYDAKGRQTVTIDALGFRVTKTYDDYDNVTMVTDARGNTMQYLFDSLNRMTVTIDQIGGRVTTLYDSLNRVTGVQDVRGGLTQYLYDGLNRQTVTINPLNGRVTTVYDDGGRVISVYDVRNKLTQYQYDGAGRVTVVIDPLNNRTTTLYNADGQVTRVTDARGNNTDYLYDANGRRTVTVDALTNRTTSFFDAAGNMTGVQDARGNMTTYLYDAAGRTIAVVDQLGNRTTTTYRSFAATKVEMEKSVSIRDDGLLSAYGNPTIPEPTLCLSLQPIIPSFASTKTRSSACCLASIA